MKRKKKAVHRSPDLIAGGGSVLGIHRSAVDTLIGLSCANILNCQSLTFRSAYLAAIEMSKVYPHLPIAVIVYPDNISCRVTVALPYDALRYLENPFVRSKRGSLADTFVVFVELPNRYLASTYESVERMFLDLVSNCPLSINEILGVYESLKGVIDSDELSKHFDDIYGYHYNLVEMDLDFYGFGSFMPKTVIIRDLDDDFEYNIDVEVFVFAPRSWDGFLEFLLSVSNASYSNVDLCEAPKFLSSLYPFCADEYFLSFVDRCEQMQSVTIANMSESLDFAYRFATEPTGTILDKFDRLLVVLPDGRIEGFHGAFISASVNPDLHLDKDISRELDRSYYFLVPDCFFDGRDHKYGFRPFIKGFYQSGYLGKFEKEAYEKFLRDMPSIIYRMNRANSEDDNDSWITSLYDLDYSLKFEGPLSRWFLNCYIMGPKEYDLISAIATWTRSMKSDGDIAIGFWVLPLPAFEDQGWRKHLDYYELRITGQQSLF
jgi:hypothetical protein